MYGRPAFKRNHFLAGALYLVGAGVLESVMNNYVLLCAGASIHQRRCKVLSEPCVLDSITHHHTALYLSID